VDTVLGGAEFVVLPGVPVPAPTIAETTEGTPERVGAVIARITRNTRAINYLGLPAVALPCGFSPEGLPVAAQLVGRPWTEPLLLKVADAFQRATSFHLRTPQNLTSMDAPA
jgi:aspartyl-tRNA(Asn)/glutamyl-tRNA(Gln) amidotransferase subunit A